MNISKTIAAGVLLATTCALAQAQTTVQFLEFAKAWGTVVADFNRDGHDDIFVVGHDSEDRIWYWTPTGYIPSPNTFPWVDRHDCDAADVNRDGRLDLYCAVGAEKGTALKANELWLQQPNGQFAAKLNFGAEDPSGSSRYPKFFDLDHDGFPDLYSTSEGVPRSDGLPDINHVYVNHHDSTFTEVQTIATGALGWQCVAKGDIDGDGWDDLLVCSAKDDGQLYVNNHANDFTLLASPAVGKWRDAKLVDMNGDGRDDLVAVDFDNVLRIFLNTGASPYFTTAAYTDQLPPNVQSLTVGDFNQDGRKDVYVVIEAKGCEPVLLQDNAPDVMYWGAAGATWTRQTLVQAYAGCGHLADTIDGNKVLLENGGVAFRGPNYVLNWGK